MPGQLHQPNAAKRRCHRAAATCGILLCALTPACDPPARSSKPRSARFTESNTPLAAARIDLAKSRFTANAADEALALLVSALEANPKSAEARAMAGGLLANSRWHLPQVTLNHRLPIDLIGYAAPDSMWVSLAGDTSTTVRWNLKSLAIESVLFPIQATETRSMVIDPTRRVAVIERAGLALLCNAQSLKPIRNLGPLPGFVTPSATVVFSADGLLVAHPSRVSANDRSLVWQLRDAATGEIIRSSDPTTTDHPRPLAAFLDRQVLRVLHADGSLLEMPVSPVEPLSITPPSEPLALLHAQYAANGGSAITLKDPGPHLPPQAYFMSMGGPVDPSLEDEALLERFPWSRHPCLWTDLLGQPKYAALEVIDRSVRFPWRQFAPIHSGSAITALASGGNRIAIGEKNGTLTVYETLPVPLAKPGAPDPEAADEKSLASLHHLTEFLAGTRYDTTSRNFTRRTPEQRLQEFKDCDFDALRWIFPELDFSPLVAAMKAFQPGTAAPEALLPLTARIERSTMPATDSPARNALAKVFASDDRAAVTAAIQDAGGKGLAAATALELALASTHPEWIDACLDKAIDLPPLLRRIAISRIAWLQDRKADALAGWPDAFPDLKDVRLREDWDGWEQADFSQALEKLRLCVGEELAAIEVPANPTPEQRKAVAARLNDPATLRTVGRARFSKACLNAALAFASFKDETETTFALAARARELGEAPAPCLRAEAMALTALGDYKKAHSRWISLITDNPVETHQPGDYAEASYTAFENADPRQAMAILTTGLHRFPNDANFALRAGWVALLTGNAERAYRFLLTGRQIGFPAAKLENATALLAIAAAQTGAAEDAAAFYQDLIQLDADWKNPATIESLEWPDEMKASLRQLVW
jgi:hypothetical protein